jgi:zinc/manganese transport system substrate-binding protein
MLHIIIKKLLKLKIAILVIFISFGFSSNAKAKLNIFACEAEWAALTKEIVQDKANIYVAVKSGQDAHYLQARPSLINQARKADFLICNGADLEIGWLNLVIQNSRNNNIKKGNMAHFMAADHVQLLEIPKELDRKYGDIHAYGNPHLHLNPNNLLIIAKKLTIALVKTDPSNKNFYEENLKKFIFTLTQNLNLWQKKAQKLAQQKIIVIHKRYVYLVEWLGLNQVATIEELPGISPSLRHLKDIKQQFANQDNILAIIAPFDSNSYIKWLIENTNSKIVTLPFAPAENQDIFSFYNEIITKLTSAQN